MKAQAKKLIPQVVLPAAQKYYWRFFGRPAKADFSKEQLDMLPALKCRISYNKYGGYCVPESSRHRPAAQAVLSNDVYEPRTIEFMRTNCGLGDIVHAGTYFGDFLPGLSSGCAPGAKVWAFEPNSESYRCARITLEINGIENVELENAGVGSKRETLWVKTKDHTGMALGGGSRIIADAQVDDSGTEPIQIVRVDEAVGQGRNVSIIQFDVEGYEKEALIGALETIRRCRPILILEVLKESELLESEWFSENILSLGYRKTADIHGNAVFMS